MLTAPLFAAPVSLRVAVLLTVAMPIVNVALADTVTTTNLLGALTIAVVVSYALLERSRIAWVLLVCLNALMLVLAVGDVVDVRWWSPLVNVLQLVCLLVGPSRTYVWGDRRRALAES